MFARQLLLDFAGQRVRGANAFASWEWCDGASVWRGEMPRFEGEPIAQLRAALSWTREQYGDESGAIGFFGYEFARALEPSAFTRLAPDDLGLPDARLVFWRRLTRETFPLATAPQITATPPDLPVVDDSHRAGVDAIRAFIASGDIYQANLTHRFSTPLSGSPTQLYERLRAVHAMPRAAMLDFPDFAIVSNSPELFLKIENNLVTSQPIKGTIRRGATLVEDETLKRELQNSPKERAENVMIVDLLRNDLGRVCRFGSVRVPELFAVQTFPTLHHLVSTVQGELRPEYDALDAFACAFPCGSITGAPKIRAMQILSELEPVRRGAAMGAIGYFGNDGRAEWNVAIRTATCANGHAVWHAGGGIVWDSRAEAEETEMRLKASALARAVSGS